MAPGSKSLRLGKSDVIRSFKGKESVNNVLEETKVLVEETDSTPTEHEIHGFENEVSSLENFLLDQKIYYEFKSLVVLGEYGVGKTTLCKMVFNDKNVKNVYAPRIWVSMQSKETGTGEDKKIYVLKRILKGLLLDDNLLESIGTEAGRRNRKEAGEMAQDTELSALLYAINLNLKWKKYLIVFDDVRVEDNWDQNLGMDEKQLEGMKWGTHLSDGFPKGSGGRVIYTSRDKRLAEKLVAETHEIHRLWPLSDTETVRKIYEEALKENGKRPWRIEHPDKPHSGNEKKCIEELMNKSRGLPLVARMMAKSDPVFEDKAALAGPTVSANNQKNK